MQDLIYVIEDEENIRDLLSIALESYSYKVRTFATAEDGLAAIENEVPDLAIFDIMLPKMDGVTAVKLLRQKERTEALPIIFLTAKGSEIDKVIGLDSGADDYICKPFGVLELNARIRSLLRRSKNSVPEAEGKAFVDCFSGEIVLQVAARRVTVAGKEIELTPKEFKLLHYFMRNEGKVMSRDEITVAIWGDDFYDKNQSRTLDMHVLSLRHKLGEYGKKYIKTVRGVGYRFIAGE